MKLFKANLTVFIILFFSTFLTNATAGNISIDYEDADIKIVIKSLGEIIGTNYIIDPLVDGKVTLTSPKQIDSNEAEALLLSILNVNGYTVVTENNISKIIPLNKARQSNLPIVTGREKYTSSDKMVTHLTYLKYSEAKKVADIINPLVSPFGTVSYYAPTNMLIITDSSSNINRFIDLINAIDSKQKQTSTTANVVYLKNTDADKMAESLNKIYEEKKKQRSQQNTSPVPVIIPNTETNALLIIAYPQEYSTLLQIIEKLDITKPQVLIEVVIAEISLTKTLDLGIELATSGGYIYGTQSGYSGAQTNGITKSIATGGGLGNTAIGFVEGSKTLGNILIPDIGGLISLAATDDDINILSVPQIVTTNNEEAKILVGQNLAFIKNSQVSAEGSIVKTFDFRDVGLILHITPHINENGEVRLKIKQEIEEVSGVSFEGAIETNKRELITQLTVQNMSTAVMGGLVTENDKKLMHKVPILGSIPLLGMLFRTEHTYKQKMNLMLFITPKVIRNQQQADVIYNQKNVNKAEEDAKQEQI